MDVARCTLDDVVYQATRFSILLPSDLAQKRKFLVCPNCGGPSFFRKASRSGQAACFGARPHEIGCSLAAPEYEKSDDGQGDDQDTVDNPGQRIVVDFNFGALENDRHNDPDAIGNPSGRGGRYVGGGARPDATMHRRLSTILRNLVVSEQFRTSQQILEISGVGEFSVADFFVPFASIMSEHDGKYRGYWGMISDARMGQNGSLWLNSGGKGDVSLVIGEALVNQAYERFNLGDEEDIAGAYALVFGTLRMSQNGKKYVEVENLGFFTLRLE
ncbi:MULTISPECIES: hypothetical protein [unclassified Undibacterium]|uniref:hypothetical protein n=1 Tax=unclassified Undibacterium TaxID=2630295 RepID=UPI002AC8DA82|nr:MULTISPECIES: hypothetical protein [unclassified Undibacterium]MEB0137650.1 hypothetical protein [Undibacterium sp. CCC2.1]MEB0170651.1 hypothetical protein [Undibacterium sp. CCC1.1]MEB0174592.1 hypothetical protein [Undibacterium sp. CCC3.4]MEB0213610.1 hypothetical protein [Undibacterium sp. 5I2]WPX43778.1 hypothetical protein RHM61_00645 [Undibacterium sp. CCC3.4]